MRPGMQRWHARKKKKKSCEKKVEKKKKKKTLKKKFQKKKKKKKKNVRNYSAIADGARRRPLCRDVRLDCA